MLSFSRKRQLAQKGEPYGQVKRHGPKYPYKLNFYTYPPLENITIEEFETFALDRLQVLKAIEGATLREKSEEQVVKSVNEVADKYMPLHSNDAEKDSMWDELSLFARDPEETFYVVDFEKVTELISRRAVYLKGGKAYVPTFEQVTLALNEFRKKLEAALILASKAFPNLDDERIMPLLNNINKQYFGKTFTGNSTVAGKVTADDVDNLVEHFPLCMQHLHNSLRASKHLKHYGRRQYNLFLKVLDPYFVTSSFNEENLRVIVTDNGRRNLDQFNDIISLVREKHYQVACTKYFEITRNLEENSDNKKPIETISHPNQYFENSVKLAKGSADTGKIVNK
ncbi:11588_t:CDS:2 [Acaulospora colombiana]|uniref:11588_t:CDS:1 n=1 Tax=Acaulospora colombiana TaxID=27376 RepID=A0ACA9K2J9_9GLOM|nr:11588_t:CDS:2 [Acaulospora colombiana]